MVYDETTMKVKICKDCKGLGFLNPEDPEHSQCPNCHGTGRIIIRSVPSEFTMDTLDNNTISFDKETMKVKVCKSCKGLGYHLLANGEHVPCEDCKGHGRIIKSAIDTEYTFNQIFDSNN